ncbi:MAG TPA: hypothetical protein VFQ42_22170 [Mycobacterium sp.]|nr:hypothetical protein [Mycobacterium sp.]
MSRDPARIDRMCDLLRQLWHKHPDQRMGQLVANVTDFNDFAQLFNIEDDITERKLTAAIEGGFGAAWRTK